jgi:putative transposase
LLLERGVSVSYESIRRWHDRFGAQFAHRAQASRPKAGSTWHLDEMFVSLRVAPYVRWRSVDEHVAELDVLLRKRRDKAAAKRFFWRVLRSNRVPRKIVTDQLRSYPAAKADNQALKLWSNPAALRLASTQNDGLTPSCPTQGVPHNLATLDSRGSIRYRR